MIKVIKKKLSLKIFFITFVLFGLVSGGTFLCISQLLPKAYSDLLNGNVDKKAMLLAEQLADYDKLSECEDLLERFSEETNAVFWIEDVYGNQVYPKEDSAKTETFAGDTAITFVDEAAPEEVQAEFIGSETKFYSVAMKKGEDYTLAVKVDLYAVHQVTDVLWSIFPYFIFMAFMISVLCSVLYAKHITRPIVALSKASKQMAELDFSGKCDDTREDELGSLAENLNYLSASLSAAMNELTSVNEQLRTDMEKEQELERQRIDFFAAASHEMKTPLTILKGHLNGMINNIKGYENHIDYMKRSLNVVDKMETLVKELLYISRSESNKGITVYETVDLAEIFRVQIADVTDLFLGKKQSFDVELPNCILCEVVCSQMERAIQNIIVNAVRYSPDGAQIKAAVSVSHDSVHCEVENTGIHIPHETLPHLFEAFYRVDYSRNRGTGGTGLGLYIVKTIMENHHAKYGIKNTEQGVMFWFDLPAKNDTN
ncbi:MAG: HAMP domain-containing histidine kinase [Clostridium sp.]|nr:HAMP domain-containing histidine kinase [Clostridium sp.]MCM1550289.1 HAMP domain-containing histidine kinase [Clostridium sp.]